MTSSKRAIYVPLSVHYSRDAAIAAAGEAAELLFVRGLAYCKGTDDTGFIPDFEMPVVAVRLSKVQQRVDALVEHELWLKIPGGYQVRSWDVWNDDATAQRKRDQAAARQQAKRDRKRVDRDDSVTVTRDDRDGHVPNLTQHNTTELNSTTPPTTSSLVPLEKSTRGTRLPADWQLPETWGQWAISEGLSAADVRREAAKFGDFWHAKTGRDATKNDWAATWRTWVRRCVDDSRAGPGKRSASSRVQDGLAKAAEAERQGR